MNDHFPATRVLERPDVVAPDVAPENDVAKLLPGMAVAAASRAFDLAYHDETEELNAALLAAAPLIRIAEVDDALVEVEKLLAATVSPGSRVGIGQVRDLLLERRTQLGAVR